ncbi:pseudouridine synthase [Thalassospira lucentensis]|uniref:pseudouridine synthase n=1 Tax=Thalassospira lucentensis TaxID=168935 RepID=UPI003D2EF347
MSDKNPTPDEAKPERIAKRIARSGVCSRRDAERMIEEGLVKLNGKVLDTPAVTVTDEDEIYVNGKPLPEKEKPRLWRLFKKRGLVTSHRDEQGRDTVFEHLPSYVPRVISVGRLDLNSEGLLLLTNDGELARYLELPATGWARRYRVRVHGRIEPEKLKQLEDGVTVDGIQYGSIHAEVDVQKDSNAWMTVTLREGKNREIRRVMEHLGWPVTRLMRVSYGPFQLGSLAPGDCEEITGKVMKEQLAAFFKGDYSKVSEKKSVARGGTARPKAPRTVFGQPAQRKRQQGGPGANPQTTNDAEEPRDSRPRSGGTARPDSARSGSANSGKPRIGAAPRANMRSKPATRDDRFEREDRDERSGGNARPTNKGRGRYSAEGKSGGTTGGKPGGSTGGPRSRNAGGRDTEGRSGGGSGRDGGRDSGRGSSGRDGGRDFSGRDTGRDSGRGGSGRDSGRDSNKRDGSGFSNARNKPLRQSSGGRSGNAGTSTPGRKPAGNRPKARKD